MRFWFRSLAVGALVGLGIGFVVGGTLGRIFMRVLFFTRQDTRGIETAMGAIIGELTSGGTVFICIFGAIMGVGLGLAYVGLRALLPSTARWRAPLFVCAASGLMLGFLVRINREDFALLPVTLSLLLIAGSVAPPQLRYRSSSIGSRPIGSTRAATPLEPPSALGCSQLPSTR